MARMDELGIDKQLLLLTSPGVQVLEPDEGAALAQLANDRLAEACRRYPRSICRADGVRPAGCSGGRRGDRARHAAVSD